MINLKTMQLIAIHTHTTITIHEPYCRYTQLKINFITVHLCYSCATLLNNGHKHYAKHEASGCGYSVKVWRLGE